MGDALVIRHETFTGSGSDEGWTTTRTDTINGARRCQPGPGAPPLVEEGL